MKTSIETHDLHPPSQPLSDLRALVGEAEQILKGVSSELTTDSVASLRQRFETARTQLTGLYNGAKRQVTAGAHCADDAIRTHPYQSLAVAAGVAGGVGLLIGVLLGRRHA